ncbi:MAG: hypothetical protein ACXAEN_25870 [Candidatus Thorarchaeota archaeon]|jgi:hypothetical protein
MAESVVAELVDEKQDPPADDAQSAIEQELALMETESNLPANTKAPEPEPMDFIAPMVQNFLDTAGKLVLTDDERKALTEPIPPEEIEIRPDGLIFPGWHWCADRMDAVFGPGMWVLTPLSMPKYVKRQELIFAPFALHIRGNFVGYAIGEQKYQPTNATMTYGDACEGAKSNALLRLCKPLIPGMRRMWNQRFIAEWKATYAETYMGIKKTEWRRKGTPPNGADQFEFLAEMQKCKKHGGNELYYQTLKRLGYDKSNKVTAPKKRIEVLNFMRSKTGYNPYDKEVK